MKLLKLPLSQIKVGERMRKNLGDLSKLREAIRDGQLVHPPTCDENLNLIAGGRRFAAHEAEGCAEIEVNVREGPTTEIELRMMELMENLDRLEMTWQERVGSIAEVHRLAERDAHSKSINWSRERTGNLLGVKRARVIYCVFFDDILKNPKHPLYEKVSKSDSLSDAIRICAQEKEDEAKRLLVASSLTAHMSIDGAVSKALQDFVDLPTMPVSGGGVQAPESTSVVEAAAEVPQAAPTHCIACEGVGTNSHGEVCPICQGNKGALFTPNAVVIPLSKMVQLGDCVSLMYSYPEESFNHIQSDPPYAIDTEMMNQGSPSGGLRDLSRTENEHRVDSNLKLLEDAIPAMYRVLRPGGFCVLWTDEETREHIRQLALHVGFGWQRWSLYWVKTGVCKNEAANTNFTKATEIAVVMRKGVATLTQPQGVNYKLCGHADKSIYKHPFAKPPELLEWVWRAIATPGQQVLDPFMGCGTGVYSAAKVGLAPTGMELVEHHRNEALLLMMQSYRMWMAPRNVEFA